MLVVVVGGVIPIAVARIGGALGVPHNDDWAYFHALRDLTDRGVFDAQDWAGMSLFGQIVLFAPLAILTDHSIAAIQVGTVVCGVVGLLALVSMGDALGLPRAKAVLVACVVAVGPFWAPLATSFMTDIPAFFAATLALAFGVRSVRRGHRSMRLLIAAVATGLVATTIREYFVIVPAASIVVWWLTADASQRRADRYRLVTVALVAGGLAAAFLAWRAGVPGGNRPIALHAPDLETTGDSLVAACRSMLVIGLLTLPVSLTHGPVRTFRDAWSERRGSTTAIVVGVCLATAAALQTEVQRGRDVLLGNYLSQAGTLGSSAMVPTRDPLIPDPWFGLLALTGAAGFALAALVLLRQVPRRPNGTAPLTWMKGGLQHADPAVVLIGATITIYTVGLFALSAINSPIWDRYLLVSVAWSALLLARPVRITAAGETGAQTPRLPNTEAIRPAALVATVLLAALGLVYSTDSATDDGVRWRFAEQLARTTPAEDVGGGFEWQGWYRGAPDALRPDRFCIVVEYDFGQEPPGAPRMTARSLTRETRLVARRNPACEND